VKRRPRLVSRTPATLAASAVERACRLARRRPPVCREMVRTLLHGHRYDGSRAERDLGLRYTDPRETIRRTVAWAREAGLLRNA
jgi:dihydroflavonol-4-reductase